MAEDVWPRWQRLTVALAPTSRADGAHQSPRGTAGNASPIKVAEKTPIRWDVSRPGSEWGRSDHAKPRFGVVGVLLLGMCAAVITFRGLNILVTKAGDLLAPQPMSYASARTVPSATPARAAQAARPTPAAIFTPLVIMIAPTTPPSATVSPEPTPSPLGDAAGHVRPRSPAPAVAVAAPVAATTPPLTRALRKEREHIIQKGDTLYSIARLNSTSVTELVRINNLPSPNAVLPIGRVLLLS